MPEMTDTGMTYNDGCPQCGHWKEWPLFVGDDSTLWVRCFKCGHQWPADPQSTALLFDETREANDLDPAHHQCPTCTVRTAVEHAHSDPRRELVLEVWHEPGCPTEAAERVAADDPWAHSPRSHA